MQDSAVDYTRLRWLFATLLLRHPSLSQQAAWRVRCVMSIFLRNDSRCRRYVSVLSNVTPRYTGSEQKGRISSLKLTFSSRLVFLFLRWKTADTAFVALSFSFHVWRCLLTVVMSLLSTPSTANHAVSISMRDCQIVSVCILSGEGDWCRTVVL